MQQYYEALEINSDVSQLELKRAYRDLMTVWHPDNFAHNERLRSRAVIKTQQLNAAYAALKKSQKPSGHRSQAASSGWQHSGKQTQASRASERFSKDTYSGFQSSTFGSCGKASESQQDPRRWDVKGRLFIVKFFGFILRFLQALYNIATYPIKLLCDFVFFFFLTQGTKAVVVLVLCVYSFGEIKPPKQYSMRVEVLQAQVVNFYGKLSHLR